MAKQLAKDKILEAAQELMTCRGYSATTIDQIIDKAGVAKGSFYHAFASKEDLAVAALIDYEQKGWAFIAQGPFKDIQDPVKKALGFLQYLEDASAELWAQGCMLGSVAMEVADHHPSLIKKVDRLFGEFEDNLAEIFTPALKAKRIKTVTGKELAVHLLAVIEGAIVTAKSHSKNSYIKDGLKHFKQYFQLILGLDK